MKLTHFLGGLLALGALSAPLAAQTTVHVLAQIDGRSRLILAGDTAQWQHFEFAAPGRIECNATLPIEPTLIDGHEWWPAWPDVPDCENRDCGGCTSDVLTGISPALPVADFQVTLNPLVVRGSATIVEYPDASNGYRVVVELDDNSVGGSEWYEFELAVTGCGSVVRYCTATPNSTGYPATIGVAGSLVVADNDLHLLAYQCPPSRPGVFLCGQGATQLPFGDGYLCISPYYPGLRRIGGVQLLDASGFVNYPMSFSTAPSAPPIVGGSSWNFQFWYRDAAAGGSGTNLTDALRVTFCP